MSNSQQFHAARIVPLPDLETRFNNARAFILQHHPDEQVGEFVSMEGLETMHHDDLEILKVRAGQVVAWTERRSKEVHAELDEADSGLREQDLTEMEQLKRALYDLAARVTKLEGGQGRRLPALPHVMRADVPQLLGMPGGVGRPGAPHTPNGGVRKLGTSASSPAADAPAAVGFTRREHPLDVIGGSNGPR